MFFKSVTIYHLQMINMRTSNYRTNLTTISMILLLMRMGLQLTWPLSNNIALHFANLSKTISSFNHSSSV